MAFQLTKTHLAAIVSCGDELTTGRTVDTNSAWLSQQLGNLGVTVVLHITVPDDAAATTDALARAAEVGGWVILTGGLGPTPDDLTRQAVADLFSEPLELRPESLAQIQTWFVRFNRPMAEANKTQALAPRSATMIRNDWGTAPGLRFTWRGKGGSECFCLPGVPSEMRGMFAAAVAPAIRQRIGGDGVVAVRTIHTFGIGESDLAGRLGELLARGRNPQLGTTASAGSVSVRIYARAESAQAAAAMIEQADRAVVDRLGDELCVGRDGQSLESVVGDLLRTNRQTLAIAESCTGGLLSGMITAVPGSSDYFLESAVTYANRAKIARLGVVEATLAKFGAVSEPVAAEMAVGEQRAAGADWAISITGIAGPGGGSVEKPVGLVFIGIAGPGEAPPRVHRHIFPGEREIVRLRSARNALNWLRLSLRT